MKKYFTAITIYWQRALTYRFSIVAYRIGEVTETLVLILLWTAIYEGQELIRGFTLEEMVTYVLMGTLFSVATRNFGTGLIAREIKDGILSTLLVKPINYLAYDFFRGLGRRTFVSGFSVLSQLIVMLFFLDTLILNLDFKTNALILVMLILTLLIESLLSYLLGLIAFWTDEVDGIFETFGRIRQFFAGGYFPLSLLPLTFLQISFALPFAYSFFVPAQLYLGKMDFATGVKGLGVQVIWIFILYAIIQFVWKRGLRRYEGIGI